MACSSRRVYDKIWIGKVMARGKYLSLEEARKAGQLEQFAKEHPIEDVHPQAHPEARHSAVAI